mgnify:CR=1 FL=1
MEIIYTQREKEIIERAEKKYPNSRAGIPALKIQIINTLEKLARNSTNGERKELRAMADYYRTGEE